MRCFLKSEVKKNLIIMMSLFIIVSCQSMDNSLGVKISDQYSDTDSPKKLKLMREYIKNNPNDIEARLSTSELESQLLKLLLSSADNLFELKKYEEALASYTAGLELFPYDYFLNLGANRSKMYIESENSFMDAKDKLNRNKLFQSQSILKNILREFPLHEDARSLLMDVEEKIASKNTSVGKLISLNFDKIDLKSALIYLCENYGLNVVFDQSVKEVQVSLKVESLTFYDAFKLLLNTTKHSFSVVNESTVLVFSDTQDRRNQFSPLEIKTFKLKSASAEEMAKLIKSVFGASGANNLTVNEGANTLIVSDTHEKVLLVEQLIQENDLPKSEVLLGVEIMEVNLSLSEQKGIDYGAYQIGATTESVPVIGSISKAIAANTTLAIPSIGFTAFKQDVGAKTLANPSVRVLDKEKAKIHIGDRVPLRTSDILDATGQTRTTFEYQEIGIRLSVEPTIHQNDYVTIKMALEVSSLGENLGTQDQQAYRIGTRNAETVMYVKNGETAILGGLIRGEERSSVSSIPFLGDLMFIKHLFRSSNDSSLRSDVLLTITPKILRSSNFDTTEYEALSVGTANNLSMNQFSELSKLKLKPKPPEEIVLKTDKKLSAIMNEPERVEEQEEDLNTKTKENSNPNTNLTNQKTTDLSLSFLSDQYSADIGEKILVEIEFESQEPLDIIEYEIMFNPDIVRFIKSEDKGLSFTETSTSYQSGDNVIKIKSENTSSTDEAIKYNAGYEFIAKRSGTSFLMIRDLKILNSQNQSVPVDVKNSRIQVQ